MSVKNSRQEAYEMSQMMQNFLRQNSQLPQDVPQSFAMEQLRRDLDGYRTNAPRIHSPGWAAEFDPAEQARVEAAFQVPKSGGFVPAGFTPAEFQRFQQMERTSTGRVGSPTPQTPLGMNGYRRPMGMGYGMNVGMTGSYMGLGQRPGDPLHKTFRVRMLEKAKAE